MNAIDDLIGARAEMPEGMVTNDGNGFAIRHRRIVGEFDSGSGDAEFFVLAAQKVPMLKAERDAERKVWARYVRAERAAMCAKRDGGGLDDWHAEQADAEHEAAKQALLALGVDVDSLSELT